MISETTLKPFSYHELKKNSSLINYLKLIKQTFLVNISAKTSNFLQTIIINQAKTISFKNLLS